MSEAPIFDLAIIGGGIVGSATAMALTPRLKGSVVVLESEPRLANHQTGNNSGVIHSGLYYKPGSLKAQLCVDGREKMIRFCEEQGLPYDRCGKVVVATKPEETPALDELEKRGRANGLDGLRRIGPAELAELEPHVKGTDGLWVPQTGIINYRKVTEAFGRRVQELGGEVRLDTRFLSLRRETGALVLETSQGPVRARNLINCAGLQSDRVARACGVEPGVRIVPFRGEYYEIVPERHSLVRNLIYPVPDPRFPFLGVHFTRMIEGGVEAGPNAVLAFKREGYTRFSFSFKDAFSVATYGGFWRMAAQHWRMGFGEMYRSFNKGAFVKALQALIPELTAADLKPGGAGVRAQAMEPSGKLVDDFRIVEAEHMVHVLNAPSPAATASIAIGESIAERATRSLGL